MSVFKRWDVRHGNLDSLELIEVPDQLGPWVRHEEAAAVLRHEEEHATVAKAERDALKADLDLAHKNEHRFIKQRDILITAMEEIIGLSPDEAKGIARGALSDIRMMK